MNISEAILSRKSTRTYSPDPIDEALLRSLFERFDLSAKLNNVPQRLLLMSADIVEPAMTGLVGAMDRSNTQNSGSLVFLKTGNTVRTPFFLIPVPSYLSCMRSSATAARPRVSCGEVNAPLRSGSRVTIVPKNITADPNQTQKTNGLTRALIS